MLPIRGILVLALAFAFSVVGLESGRVYRYGKRADFRIPMRQLAKLKRTYPANPEIVVGRHNRFYQKSFSYDNHRCPSRPYAVFIPKSIEETQAVVRLIGQYNQTFVLLSGGHDFECASSSTGAVVNLRRLNHYSIDKKNLRYTVGPGVVSKQILDALKGAGLQAVIGGCLTVGVVGWTLGGGYNDQISNIYGLGSTNVLEAKVILSDGRLVTATRDNEHKDLLWAVMGAGGGKFGVVVEMTARLHRMKPLDYREARYRFPKHAIMMRDFVADVIDLVDNKMPSDSDNNLGKWSVGEIYLRSVCVDCGLAAIYKDFDRKWSKYQIFFQYNSTNNVKNGGGHLDINWESITADPAEYYSKESNFELVSFIFQGKKPPVHLVVNEYLLDIQNTGVFVSEIHNVGKSPALTSYPYVNGTWLAYIHLETKPEQKLEVKLFHQRIKALIEVVRQLPSYLGSYVNVPSCLIPEEAAYLKQNYDQVKKILSKYDPNLMFKRPPCHS